METIRKRSKTGGRQKGTLNRATADIRQALRDLAEGNAHRVQEWLDRVAQTEPAEALRLWLALLRFVTPTLQAAAYADMTPPQTAKGAQEQLYKLTTKELMQIALGSPQGTGIRRQRESADASSYPDQSLEAEDEEILR